MYGLRGRRFGAADVDLILAPGLVVWFWLQFWLLPHGGAHRAATLLVGTVLCAGLAFRRTHPLIVGFGTQALLSAVNSFLHLPAGPVTVAWFCALYALAVWTSTRWFAVAVVFVVLANGGPGVLDLRHPGIGAQFGLGAAGVLLLVRLAVGGRDRQLMLAEREREVASREAVVEERERIARELHDVIAHHVSTMVVQAGAERRVLGDDQASTRDVLGTIEGIGRGALTEMRRMVGMLRQEPERDLAPQPSLEDVPALVEQMKGAGLAVTLRVTGDDGSLPAGIALSAYRIVQEALTNALKHAAGAATHVAVDRNRDRLEIVVSDDGAGHGSPLDAGGHGLVGMRERVAMFGGTIEAGPLQPAGFAVRVRLPVR
jgi:signal transduction histidine kinase